MKIDAMMLLVQQTVWKTIELTLEKVDLTESDVWTSFFASLTEETG